MRRTRRKTSKPRKTRKHKSFRKIKNMKRRSRKMRGGENLPIPISKTTTAGLEYFGHYTKRHLAGLTTKRIPFYLQRIEDEPTQFNLLWSSKDVSIPLDKEGDADADDQKTNMLDRFLYLDLKGNNLESRQLAIQKLHSKNIDRDLLAYIIKHIHQFTTSNSAVEEESLVAVDTHTDVSKEHIGISIDWDGCGDILAELLDKKAATKHISGNNLEDAYKKKRKRIEACTRLMTTIMEYLPPDHCVVHIFIGSNRQSHYIDRMLFDYSKSNERTLMFPYWDPIVKAMNTDTRYSLHQWVFEPGSCSDDILALENPKEIVKTNLYGSGWINRNKLYHEFNNTLGSTGGYDIDLKDKLNRYHAWKLYSSFNGKKLIFFDDRKELIENLTKIGDYPQDMTIIGQRFDYHDFIKLEHNKPLVNLLVFEKKTT